ncbi:hypothetical protein XENOCAPTIV_005475 [Xenoophorus captivus]|uniref:Uncharacterized protein n=1 Tax=Xenoophorus captivus TaxID=1517983 RepID=A0ABV0RZ41_9TELE
MHACDGTCQNTVGSYTCHCDGRQGLRLAADKRYCESIPVCVDLMDYKHPQMLYLGEQFAGFPVIYLRFRLPENTKFAAEFDFRTFDPEGVVLYAESSSDSWFMLGLRAGDSRSWKVDVMMNIRPSSSTGVLLALVYNNTVPLSVAVVTKGEEDAVGFLILINTFMFTSDQTFVTLFEFALQNLQVFLDGVSVATLDSLMLCYPDRLMVQLNVTPTEIQISANSSTVSYIKSDALQKALEHLNTTMQNPIGTYIGGIPG